MSIGDFPESLSQAMLVGTMLVGGLGAFYMRSLPGWLQTRPARNTLHYIKIELVCLKEA